MKKQQITVNGSVLTVEYPTIGKKFVVDLSKYQQSIRDQATLHGFKQRFGDAESGKEPAAKYAMVQRLHASMMEGSWELETKVDHSAITMEAICRIKKIKIAELEKHLEKLTEEKRAETLKEWGSNVKVKAVVAQIRAERAAEAAEEADEDIEINLK